METLLYFAFFGLLIFLMMRFGCGAHATGHGHGHSSSAKGEPSPDDRGVRWIPPQKETDPVCGMTVETANAKSAVHGGAVYYFCSAQCRDKFEASPAAYAKASAPPSGKEHHHEAHH